MRTGGTDGRRLAARCAAALIACAVAAEPAWAQSSIADVLGFLLTNRSIATGDFVRDDQAAAEAAAVIERFFTLDLSTLPATPSAAGFAYRLEPTLGTVVRSTDSFGPFYTERALTAGRGQASVGIAYRSMAFDALDGHTLRDGALVSTASILRGDGAPFDVETVALRIRTDTMTLTGNVGVTDRWDVGAVVPVVRVTLDGQRLDTYRGSTAVQASGSASASGLGDVVLRTKVHLWRDGASGLALAGDARLPTGDEADLLGAGRLSVTPRLIGSYERARVAVHGELGYSFRSAFDAMNYAGALTLVAAPRVTLVGEVSGLRLSDVGRVTYSRQPHPRLIGVDTIRLTTQPVTTHRAMAVAGLKWNVADTWLLTANVRRPLDDTGLTARWVPTLTLDYAFGR